MKKSILNRIVCMAVLIGWHAFGNTQDFSGPEPQKITNPPLRAYDTVVSSIISYGKNFIGKPYRYRLAPGVTFDCSGYMQYIFKSQSLDIPRSSASISAFAEHVELDDVQVGDFLFFKGRSLSSSSVGHVSLVIDKDSSGIKMLHSCSRGVVIDEFPMEYYTKRFMGAGRFPVAKLAPDIVPPDTSLTRSQIREMVDETDSTDIEEDKKLEIIGVGDIMLGTNFPSERYLPPNDGKDLLKPVDSILKSADLTFGNLEGVILSGPGDVKKCSDPEFCYAFKSPDHYLTYLKEAGFDVLSIANNHVGDFGDAGRANTVKRLQEEGLAFAGLYDHPYMIFEKDSVTYGFAAFAPNTGTVRITDYDKAREIVAHLDSLSDIVIVSFHGGAEGSKYCHVTKEKEIFLGEDRGNPYEFSRIVIDAGADIVFGHGPHVTRAVDLYKDRFIAYSLGNFATYGRFNLRGVNGIAPIVKVTVNADGSFEKAQIIPVKQVGEGGPQLDEQKVVIKEIIRLTETDLPECGLVITEEGEVKRK
ncbi:MAG: CapA family protein [Brumimicrobium sp.]|nr:CapA family protein [Brumimicrobium sp.]